MFNPFARKKFEIEGGVLTKYLGKDQTVVIPDEVRKIGDSSFSLSYISNIQIPNSVREIGNNAFEGCRELISVTLPSSVVSIGSNAFRGCENLQSIAISGNMKEISDYAFIYCEKLTTVVIPNSIEKIGKQAFDNCTNLKSITIPASVKVIGDNAFSHCPKLTINCYENTAASDYTKTNGITVNIIQSRIVNNTINNDIAINNLTINNITKTNVTNNVMNNTPVQAAEQTIDTTAEEEKAIAVEKAARQAKAKAEAEAAARIAAEKARALLNATVVVSKPGEEISESMEDKMTDQFIIENGILRKYMGVSETVTIPDTVQSIGEFAIFYCADIKTLVIPDSVIKIEENSISHCDNLKVKCSPYSYAENFCKEHNIPYELDDAVDFSKTFIIDNNIIRKFISQDTEIIIPFGIKEIGEFAFGYCTFLKSVTFANPKTVIAPSAFTGCTDLKITAASGSTAEAFAKENSLKFVAL